MREDWDFITIPSLESGEEVIVEHRLPVEKLQFWKKRDDGYRDEAKPEKGKNGSLGQARVGWERFGGAGGIWRGI